MLEKLPEGGLHPYVMDFGLAREMDGKGHSRSGAIEGTPRYMAPEQARGETHHLDRRTDVYSLGITLYELLAGQSPYDGSSDVDMLLAVLLYEPKPLRVVDKSLPEDLDAIVLKCIEKEPGARYDSAKALAEDLGRYLAGEPVLAQRLGPLQRLYRKARRHKFAAAGIGVAVAAVLSLSGLVLVTQLRESRKLEQAERLGQDLKEAELFLRSSAAMPLHDVRREQAFIRARMADIAQTFSGRHDQAAALAEYALGRGYLALAEPATGRAHLEAALRLGHDTPEVHYALARTLGELFERGVDEIRFAGTPNWQEQQRQRLEKELLQPSLQHFQRGHGQRLESSHYADGLIAYYSGHYDEAILHAEATLAEAPWMYEGELLAADSLRALGLAAYRQGKHKESLDYYERAAPRYRTAREFGRSDLMIHFREAQLYIQRIQTEADKGVDPAASVEQAVLASERAIASNGADVLGYQAKAHALMRALHHRQEYGQDLGQLPVEVLKYAQATLRLDPNNAMACYFIAVANTIKFTYAVDHGSSGEEFFEEGIRYYRKLLAFKPDYSRAYNDMGCAYGLRGQWLGKHGAAFSEDLGQSVQYLKKAIQDDAEDVYPKYNLCDINTRLMKLQFLQGKVDLSLLDETRKIENDFAKLNRKDFIIYSYLGQAMVPKLMVDVAEGTALDADSREALGYLDRSISENPKFHETHRGRAEVFALRTLDGLLAGRDVTSELSDGLAAASRAVEANPIDAASHSVKARLHLYAARAAATKLKEAALLSAEAAAREALKLDPEQAEGHLLLSQIAELRGAFDDGIKEIELAFKVNPRHAEAWAQKSSLLSKRPAGKRNVTATTGQDEVRAALLTALTINPYLRREYGVLRTALGIE